MADQALASGAKGSALITLVADEVYEVTFADDLELIEVWNPASNSDDVWYTNDGTTPTVGGTNCFLVPAASAHQEQPQRQSMSPRNVIKLISSGTPSGVRVQRA